MLNVILIISLIARCKCWQLWCGVMGELDCNALGLFGRNKEVVRGTREVREGDQGGKGGRPLGRGRIIL